MRRIRIRVNGATYNVVLDKGNSDRVVIEGVPMTVRVVRRDGSAVEVEVDGEVVRVERGLGRNVVCVDGEPMVVEGYIEELAVARGRAEESVARPRGAVVAPMPGRVKRVIAEVGGRVEEGDPLVILESMKMENIVAAPRSGVVRRIFVSEGRVVNKGDPLVDLGE